MSHVTALMNEGTFRIMQVCLPVTKPHSYDYDGAQPDVSNVVSFVLGDRHLALVYLFPLCPSAVPFTSLVWLTLASLYVAVKLLSSL